MEIASISYCSSEAVFRPLSGCQFERLRWDVLNLGADMKRRDFIILLGGAAASWPLAARAQQPDRVRRIGVMIANAESDPEGQDRVVAFRRGLQELGWADGRNLRIDYRWAIGESRRARRLARELVTLEPDVILAVGTPALSALHKATTNIPIVFAVVVDPVGAGFVQSLARPGGNITGFSSFQPEIGGKWLELLKAIMPGLSRVAVISDPAFRGFAGVLHEIESIGPRVGLEITNIIFRNPNDDIESPISAFSQSFGGGLIVVPTAINKIHRNRIISLAARHHLPAIYPFSVYVASGGLLSYGVETNDLLKRSASYVDRILKGEKPADLPVQAPVTYDLVINLKTANALGLTVPPSLLARADKVIE
jgi:putative ABC transport system substrate-binding protein